MQEVFNTLNGTETCYQCKRSDKLDKYSRLCPVCHNEAREEAEETFSLFEVERRMASPEYKNKIKELL